MRGVSINERKSTQSLASPFIHPRLQYDTSTKCYSMLYFSISESPHTKPEV
jgi:hypothetical protein